jgi:hypothetical protein
MAHSRIGRPGLSRRRQRPAAVMKQLMITVAPLSSLSMHSKTWPFTLMQVWLKKSLSVLAPEKALTANQYVPPSAKPVTR